MFKIVLSPYSWSPYSAYSLFSCTLPEPFPQWYYRESKCPQPKGTDKRNFIVLKESIVQQNPIAGRSSPQAPGVRTGSTLDRGPGFLLMAQKDRTGKFDAFSVFPDLLGKRHSRDTGLGGVAPPLPPDLSWLFGGIADEKDQPAEIPKALLLISAQRMRSSVAGTLERAGYHVEYAATADEAIGRLRTTNYAVVALHPEFEQVVSPAESIIHNYLARLPMTRRRHLFYMLIGPGLHTLYNLEALSLSANVVVNDADIELLPVIFKKSYRQYYELFGTLIEFLQISP